MPPSVSNTHISTMDQVRKTDAVSSPSVLPLGQTDVPQKSKNMTATPSSARVTKKGGSSSANKNKKHPKKDYAQSSSKGNNVVTTTETAQSPLTATGAPVVGDGSNINNPLFGGADSSSLLYNGSSYGGMMGGAGLMGSPYSSFPQYGYGVGGYGGMMSPGFLPGPLSNLNQFLFGIQNVIFSLGQAVQILGMNTQALHQLMDTASTMFDHALATWKEVRLLDAANDESLSEEDKKKRRRLRAIRWALAVGVTYSCYRLVRRFIISKRKRRIARRRNHLLGNAASPQRNMGNELTEYRGTYDDRMMGHQNYSYNSYDPYQGNSFNAHPPGPQHNNYGYYGGGSGAYH